MSDKNLVARIGQIATKGKHKDRFLFVGTIEPVNSQDRFFYLIEIDSPWVDGEKIKNSITNTLSTSWSNSTDKAEKFESVVKKINSALGEISQAGEHEWVGRLNSIIGLISNDELIFSQTGRISGYLFRGNKISHITEKPLENDEIHPLKTFISIIDGSVAANDTVIIANSNLYSHFSLDRLRHIFTGFHYKDSIAEISRTLRKSRVKDVNLIVLNIQKNDDEDATEDSRPDIILLDEIPDSKLMQYSKSLIKGLSLGAKASAKGAGKVAEFWSKSIEPKISSGLKSAGEKTKNFSSSRLKPATEKFDKTPRVNYFNRNSKRSSDTIHFFANLLYWSKNLFKPENRKFLYITIIVVLLGVGFVKIQYNKNNNQGVISANESLTSLQEARDLYSKAIDDIGLKRSGGKEKLIAALTSAQKASTSPALADEANNLSNQIKVKLDEINNTKRVYSSDPNFSLNTSPLFAHASGANVITVSFDGTISKHNSRSKTVENIGLVSADFGKLIDVSYRDSDESLVAITDTPRVLKIDLVGKTISEIKLVEGATWEAGTSVATYSTNIYILDKNSGQIWKHSKTDDLYGKGTSVTPKISDNLKSGIDINIDGNIYMLKSDGTAARISKGAIDNAFKLAATPTPDEKILDPKNIFLNSETNSLYIFDKKASRVIQYSKLGAYQKQYVLDGSDLTNFAVNEKLKKLWLISETKVFEVDL